MKDIELDKRVSENLNVLKAEYAKLSGEVNNVVTTIGMAIPIAIIDPAWKLGHSKGALLVAQVLLGISMLLTACGPQSTAEISPSSTAPVATQTAGVIESPPTPIVPELSQLPPELQSKFDQAGIDLPNMTNAVYDQDGLHITLESGEVIFTNEQLAKNVYLSQPVEYNGPNKVFQIRDDSNENVLFAYDTNTGEILDASKYIQKDNSDPEKYIQVAGWDELKALWAKEKMFLTPFDPDNTYFPESKDIYRGYDDYENAELDGEFNFVTPFGYTPEGMDSSFKYVNYIKMQKDTTVGRSTDSYITSEQVFNPDDKTFSVLHFYNEESNVVLAMIQEQTADGTFRLPVRRVSESILKAYVVYAKYLKENNVSTPVIEQLVSEWFDSRHVPEELENILLIPFGRKDTTANYIPF